MSLQATNLEKLAYLVATVLSHSTVSPKLGSADDGPGRDCSTQLNALVLHALFSKYFGMF